MRAFASLDEIVLDERVKGIPGGTSPIPLGDIGGQGWNLLREDVPLPAAVIKGAALENNSRWMREFLARSGARFAPHGKTTMSPQLFQQQLSDGAWAMTVATVGQLQVCRTYGLSRIVLANQLVGRQAVRYVLDELQRDPGFDFYALVDSVENVLALSATAADRNIGRPLKLLLEVGTPGGRTGCRDMGAALATARAVKVGEPHLALCGIEGFEGLIPATTPGEQDEKVRGFIRFLGDVGEACGREGLFAPEEPVILSAGGSAFYDLVVDGLVDRDLGRESFVVTRSGCYLTHDSAMYSRFFARVKDRSPGAAAVAGGLEPALELWAYVQSRPEPGKVILTFGRRDVGSDADMPVPELWFRPTRDQGPQPAPPGCRISELNDQHAHMLVPADSPLAVGDMMAFGVSHPCTTFDKWQLIWVVDRDYDIVSGIRTFF